MSVMRRGDFLMIQMGHNDQKLQGEGIGARASYKDQLKRFIREARQRGATPILVTPVQRRTFEKSVIVNSLGDFPDAVRETASELHTPLIDLHAMSKRFYEAMGPERSALAFAPSDLSHHNAYGAYELARCVIESIRSQGLPLSRYLATGTVAFNPANPDDLNVVQDSPNSGKMAPKPYGH